MDSHKLKLKETSVKLIYKQKIKNMDPKYNKTTAILQPRKLKPKETNVKLIYKQNIANMDPKYKTTPILQTGKLKPKRINVKPLKEHIRCRGQSILTLGVKIQINSLILRRQTSEESRKLEHS